MKADPFAQLKLLDLQELDSRLVALRHQRATLPELAELKRVVAERNAVDHDLKQVSLNVDDLTREQRKADGDVETVKLRRAKDQERLDKGMVGNPKELEHLAKEIENLSRRISDLEDTELEVMERLEAEQRRQGELQQRRTELNAEGAGLVKSRDAAWATLDAELLSGEAERKTLASGIPADLLNSYERLRESKGGVGAAALRARRCSGCSLELNASDLAAIKAKPSDEVIRCEECSRILVRTAESGL